MNEANNYKTQRFEKCCRTCKHIEGHGYPWDASCDIINPDNKEVVDVGDPNMIESDGICDMFEIKGQNARGPFDV